MLFRRIPLIIRVYIGNGEDMNSRRLVILLVLALLFSPNLMIISAREVEDRDALVDTLISQAEDTKDKIDDIHDLLENLNTIIPTA